jgi:phosphoribosyl 1,2-cyclic phosphodiesterase
MGYEPGIQFRFWGVRGSIATPGPTTVRYGGNTACVEVRAADRLIIFDGGTGLRALGQWLLESQQDRPIEADLFLSHLHWDHIQGIPFFGPGFRAGNRFCIHGEAKAGRTLRETLEGQMRDPNFPVPLSIMASEIRFNEVWAGAEVPVGAATVRTAPLNHPNGCLGLRVDHGGRSLVFCTDTEHPADGGLDPHVQALAADADVLIYDAMFTDAEYRAGKVGWGHSTFEEAVRIALAARVGRLVLFHHDPLHDDDFLDARLAQIRAEVAHTGLVVEMACEGPVCAA